MIENQLPPARILIYGVFQHIAPALHLMTLVIVLSFRTTRHEPLMSLLHFPGVYGRPFFALGLSAV